MTDDEKNTALKYLPYFMKDENDPFPIIAIGYSFFYEDGQSKSSKRYFRIRKPQCSFMIEYAVYFDFDIQHLYDLEHVFIYVGENGEVMDVEASFHGKFLKSMINDALAFHEKTHPVMYMQPGKHAMMPDPAYFNLFIGLTEVCSSGAGEDGLLIAPMFSGKLKTDEETDRKIREYIRKKYSFTPSFKYIPAEMSNVTVTSYEELEKMIVYRINEIKNSIIHNNK